MPSASIAPTNTASAIHASGRPTLTMARKIAARMYIAVSDFTPPMRSATLPPIGRTSEPANTQAAVK